jgi:hypothetical protein
MINNVYNYLSFIVLVSKPKGKGSLRRPNSIWDDDDDDDDINHYLLGCDAMWSGKTLIYQRLRCLCLQGSYDTSSGFLRGIVNIHATPQSQPVERETQTARINTHRSLQ